MKNNKWVYKKDAGIKDTTWSILFAQDSFPRPRNKIICHTNDV